MRDHAIRDLIPFHPCPTNTAVRQALAERREARAGAGDRRGSGCAATPAPAGHRRRYQRGRRGPARDLTVDRSRLASVLCAHAGSRRYLGRRGARRRPSGAGPDPEPAGRPAAPGGRARAHRRRRLRAVLRRRPARPVYPAAQPRHRERTALRGPRLQPARAAYRGSQRGGGGAVLPRRPLVAGRRVQPCREDHARLRGHHHGDPQPRSRARRHRHERDLRASAPRLRRVPGPGAGPSHVVAAHAALSAPPVPTARRVRPGRDG